MYQIRKSEERGYADHGWLKSYHTFSFADYFDPQHMGFGPLRVINEDYIAASEGFPTHPHNDMEIITYPISGAIEHKDSTGSSGVIYPYEIQKMTAGRGIRHSEYNHMNNQQTHLLQIWIRPNAKGLNPSYEQKNFADQINSFEPTLLVSPNAERESLLINQDVSLWAKKNRAQQTWEFHLTPERKYWLQVVSGNLKVNLVGVESEIQISAGDALALSDETQLKLLSVSESEVLLFDML